MIRTDAPLAEKIIGKIVDLKEAFGRIGDPEAQAQHKRLAKAEKMYLNAIEAAGKKYQNGKIVSVTDEDDEEKEKTAQGGGKYSFVGVADDGKKIYMGNFPKNTPKDVKAKRIIEYIQNVWSKKPIRLRISNGETSRYVLAQFDPTIDETQNTPTDASKLAGGNRHGNHTEQRVTLDLADDYYEIASESQYNYSKLETGKTLETHEDVKMWHYFVNDIYFIENGESKPQPYSVTINVKEKKMGILFIALMQRKSPPPDRLYMLP